MRKKKKLNGMLKRLSNWDQEFSFKATANHPDINQYFEYYGFNLNDNVDHYFGKFEIDQINIIAQVFSPKTSKGTVFLVHGYLDHVGHMKNIIQFLVKHQYAVVCFDLQGHGLSDGEAASVKSFSNYVNALEQLITKVRNDMPNPFYIIGHSTGGAITIQYVLMHSHDHFDKVILAAPLIRSRFWLLSIIGYKLMKPLPFMNKVRRKFRNNSSDSHYLSFVKADPLQALDIPLDWLGALIEWNDKIVNFPPTQTDTYVIQGTNDQTVAWKYNLRFIKKKFKHLKVSYVKRGKHHLFNEKEEIREDVFQKILTYIEE